MDLKQNGIVKYDVPRWNVVSNLKWERSESRTRLKKKTCEFLWNPTPVVVYDDLKQRNNLLEFKKKMRRTRFLIEEARRSITGSPQSTSTKLENITEVLGNTNKWRRFTKQPNKINIYRAKRYEARGTSRNPFAVSVEDTKCTVLTTDNSHKCRFS